MIAAAMAVLMFCAPALALAQQSREGQTKPPNVSFWPMGGDDGATMRSLKTRPDGTLIVTEDAPIPYQTETEVMATNVNVFTGIRAIGNGATVYPFQKSTLLVTRTATGGASVDKLYLYLFGSDNNVDFYPVLDAFKFAAFDSTAYDSLKFEVPSLFGTFKVDVPQEIYVGRYLAVYAKRDSGASTVQTLTLTLEKRMD
jgi:hypothetical protein